jgi:hypothetical protein
MIVRVPTPKFLINVDLAIDGIAQTMPIIENNSSCDATYTPLEKPKIHRTKFSG